MLTDVERVKFSLREYRGVEIEDASVKTRHPLSMELTYNTLIASEEDAEEFGDYVMDLRSSDRYSWQTLLAKENYPNLEVGQTITLTHPRFGLSGGENFIVKRVKRDSESFYHEVTLFGPE